MGRGENFWRGGALDGVIPIDDLAGQVIGAAIEVHRALGAGLLESAYEECLAQEFCLRGIPFERQKVVSLVYKGLTVSHAFRVDLLVDDTLVIEVKAVTAIAPIHTAQILTYLRLGGWKLGLLLNFHEGRLVDGIKRLRL
jgi:GxxExxY protein